jgi:hypothetical protein
MCFTGTLPADSAAVPEDFFRFRIVNSNGEWVLAYQVLRPGNQEGLFKRSAVLDHNTPYCLGFRAEFGEDSVARKVEFTVNGITSLETDVSEFGFKVKNVVIRFCDTGRHGKLKGFFYINNIAYGDSWLGHPPRRPAVPDSAIKSWFNHEEVFLYSPEHRSFLVPSPHWASEFQIQVAGKDFDSALYDSGLDTLNRDSIRVSLFLDSAKVYIWRIRHAGSAQNISAWSNPETLSFRHVTLPVITAVSAPEKTFLSRFGLKRIILAAGIPFLLAICFFLSLRKK